MKYYFITILTLKDSGEKKKSIYEYDKEKAARAGIYSGYSEALNNKTVCQVLCMLIDEYGSVIETLTWIDPSDPTPTIVEPEVTT